MIIGSNVLYFENLPSTNAYATGLVKGSKTGEGLVIQAGFQPSGRGQGSNSWESEAGKNLLISIILYPNMIPPAQQFLLSAAVSLGICDFLRQHITGVSIKWPNDIYVGSDKIAGILIENSIMGDRLEHSVAGIGLNINQENFRSGAPNPVSLRMITGKNYNLDECLASLLEHLDSRYLELTKGSNDRLESDYQELLFRRNEWHRYRDSAGEFRGMIIAAGSDGLLQIKRENGSTAEYSHGELDFILP
jgi:BirA family biotin operon repressor/biotin-[acetyl-CoA-carboxylase] ligase